MFDIKSLSAELKRLQQVGDKIVLPLIEGGCPERAGRAVSSLAYKTGRKYKTELFKAIGRRGGMDVIEYFMVIRLVQENVGVRGDY